MKWYNFLGLFIVIALCGFIVFMCGWYAHDNSRKAEQKLEILQPPVYTGIDFIQIGFTTKNRHNKVEFKFYGKDTLRGTLPEVLYLADTVVVIHSDWNEEELEHQ